MSDAGTPLLSDPGFALVRAAAAAGIEVRAVPGASAMTAALSIAGLATDRFAFEGFLPARASERRALLARLATESRTLVLFEAPHRIAAALEDMARSFGDQRAAVVTRELTKMHESVYRGTLQQLCGDGARERRFRARGNHRGGRRRCARSATPAPMAHCCGVRCSCCCRNYRRRALRRSPRNWQGPRAVTPMNWRCNCGAGRLTMPADD